MNKLLIISVASLLLLIGVGLLVNQNQTNDEITEEILYQGPVPQGYDLEHFRNTGETILEVEE